MVRLSILIYHRVLAEPDPLQPDVVDAVAFTRQMRVLQRFFHVLPLGEALERLQSGSLPSRSVAVTFDDGYRDNCEVALPILQRLGLRATFFVATGFLDGGCMWNDLAIAAVRCWPEPEIEPMRELGLPALAVDSVAGRRNAIGPILQALKCQTAERRAELVEALVERTGAERPALMMSRAQVRRLAEGGMSIGAHTRSHPVLSAVSEACAREEIAGSRADLEDLLGCSVDLFAYPHGKPGHDYYRNHVEMVRRCGFRAAVSTEWATATRQSDPLELPRFTPWDQTPLRYALRLAWFRWRYAV